MIFSRPPVMNVAAAASSSASLARWIRRRRQTTAPPRRSSSETTTPTPIPAYKPVFEEWAAWPVVDAGERGDEWSVGTSVPDGLEFVLFGAVPWDPEGLEPDPVDAPPVVGVPSVDPEELGDAWLGEEPDGEGEAIGWVAEGEAGVWEESPGDVCWVGVPDGDVCWAGVPVVGPSAELAGDVFGLLAGGTVEVVVNGVFGFDEVVGGVVEDGAALLAGADVAQLRGVSISVHHVVIDDILNIHEEQTTGAWGTTLRVRDDELTGS
jgi:hypothetical protein